jgi:hypothetical protein
MEVGVRPGALLFDGRRNRNQYSGMAHVFSKGCSALPYAVTGVVSPDERTVTMYGKAPIVNSSCRVVASRDDALVFNLSPSLGERASQDDVVQSPIQNTVQTVPVQQPNDSAYDNFKWQWEWCFGSDPRIDILIMNCDNALSFSRLSADDRAKLLARRATLEVAKQFVIPTNWGPLLSLGAIIALLAIPGVLWLRQRNSRSSVTATQNPPDEAPSTAPTSNSSSKAENVIQLPAVTDNPPRSYIPNEPDPKSMALKLKRSKRSNVMGKVFFVLDARIGLNAEEHALVKKYRLGGFLIYESQARAKHREATKAHLESTREHPSLFDSPASQFLGLGKTLFRIGRASVSAAMTAYSKNITVDSLIRGEHIECESMDELLAAENAIREAARNLKGYLEEAATFDGREEVIEL